jgi:hypothetical protein
MRAYVFETGGNGCIVVVASTREQAIVMAADDGNVFVGELIHMGLTFSVKPLPSEGHIVIEELL